MAVSSPQYSSFLCFLGCVLLVPSCMLLMYPEKNLGLIAIIGLIVACLCLTIAAAIDLYAAYLLKQSIKTQIYQMLGAIFFLTASIMYLPVLVTYSLLGTTVANLGTWVFRFGSFAYLTASYRNLTHLIKSAQTRKNWRKQDALQLIAIISFIWGALFYIAGGVVGQMKIGAPSLMAELWVMGSVGFALGGFIFLKIA